MRRLIFSLFPVLAFGVWFVAGCAPKAYKDALSTASVLENRGDYEGAYNYYKEAVRSRPNDTAAQAKLDRLGRLISNTATEEGIQAFKNKKYKTASELFVKALKYNENNKSAKSYDEKAKSQYDLIRKKYSEADRLRAQDKWCDAVRLLTEISDLYNDDPEIDSKIKEWREHGHDYFMRAGLEERNKGEFSRSLKYFESANLLKSDTDSSRELKKAEKYVEADEYYAKSKDLAGENMILEAMEALIKAKQKMPEHYKVNQLMIESMSAWSAATFEIGKQFIEANQTDDSFRAFNALHQFNPGYSEVEDCYEKTKSAYLKQHYIYLVDAQNACEIPQIVAYSQNITEVEPGFLDTREIMTRAFFKAFNGFYQRGLHYMGTGNYGKAILCFRSAEQQLAETRLTQDLIEKAWEQISKISALQLTFWNFSQGIRDPSIGQYTAGRLKTLIKSKIENREFKNISFGFDILQGNGTIFEADMSRDIDWGPILSRGYNGVITGDINLLKLDKSLTSEWKIRKRMVKKIIDNEEYTRLLMRKAELNRALTSRKDRGKMSKGRIKDALERIEERIPAVPPKIEAEVLEETPYEVQKHMMTAYLQIEVQVLASDGSRVWPSKRYEETFQVEDMVIPPNLKSEDPKERKGDPLVLPRESKFREQAIDYVLEDKIIPDIFESFNDYGKRFYLKADELNKSYDELGPDSTAFSDSIEGYYKFLACYEDKGEDDTLPEKVLKIMDGHISELWLMGDEGAEALYADGANGQ